VLAQSVVGRDTVWKIRFRFPAATKYFSILTLSRSALGPTDRPTYWLAGALLPWGKRPGCESNYSTTSNTYVKNTEAINLLFHTSSWLGA
jgi:hypothetical protein